MGQKTNPIGLRLGINRTWSSIWFDEKNYAEKLHEDIIIRNFIKNKIKDASISKVNIERTAKSITVTIYTSRPGIVIGKGGSEVEKLKKNLSKLIQADVNVNVSEIKRPALSCELVGQSIAQQLEKKLTIDVLLKSIQSGSMGAEGVKIQIAGRLNGIDIARSETFKEGRIPLHTLDLI